MRKYYYGWPRAALLQFSRGNLVPIFADYQIGVSLGKVLHKKRTRARAHANPPPPRPLPPPISQCGCLSSTPSRRTKPSQQSTLESTATFVACLLRLPTRKPRVGAGQPQHKLLPNRARPKRSSTHSLTWAPHAGTLSKSSLIEV